MLLNEQELIDVLTQLAGWNIQDNRMVKDYSFPDFTAALRFVNKVGELAESKNHHPDIFLHSWNKVRLTLSTHDEGGITAKDTELAAAIDEPHRQS